ncbi:MAG: hypothetical protein ACHQ03_07805 [Candidatus Bathyarchaeia archaeon]
MPPVYLHHGRRIRRLTVKQQEERLLKIAKSKPQTEKQIARRMDLSTGRTKFYIRKLQRSTKLRKQGLRVQRINKYYHVVEKAKPQRPQEPPEKKTELWAMRAAFNSGTGSANLEIDIIVPFVRNLSVPEDRDSELLRVRNEIEEVVRSKFGKRIVYSSNFRLAPVPLRAGESTTERWRFRHQAGSWNEFR